ncbi:MULTISPECIES: XdhC family protein [unclassified Arthrobacter]|uniref:XdhC family protein n=1 Tax=unclassified Arthrobacter TaxID=235627 RepID=UPI003398F494
MLDLIPSLRSWASTLAGGRFAVATIVAATGSSPRPVGTSMLVSESGAVLGSLSGGCVEGAVVALALDAMDDGGARLEAFGYSAADAFAAGLTCGGELDIHIQPVPLDSSAHWPAGSDIASDAGTEACVGALRAALLQLADVGPGEPVALVRRLDGGGSTAIVIPDPATFLVAEAPELKALLGFAGTTDVDEGGRNYALPAQLGSLLRAGGTGLVQLGAPAMCPAGPDATPRSGATEPVTLLVESRLAPPRMLVVGANDFGAAIIPAGQLLGYHVTLVDARQAFASQARFAGADRVVLEWPHRYLGAEAAAGRVDQRTVVCVLTHDPKFDIPLLETALALDVAYVGAIGSRRSHLQRVDNLLDAGVPPERIAHLHSPIGLDLGAVTPAEVAVSVTAEVIASRRLAASCTPLRDTTGPIHHDTYTAQATRREPVPAFVSHQEIAWT